MILQTESPEGVKNAEEIYSLPGVDAIFVGPNDLKFQMRGPDGVDPTKEEHEAMLQKVLEIGKKVGTPVGVHVLTVEDVQQRIADRGMDLYREDQSEATWAVYQRMKGTSQVIRRNHFAVDTSRDIDPVIQKIIREINR